MSQVAHFLYFLLMAPKCQSQFKCHSFVNISVHLKNITVSFMECIIGFGVTVREILRVETSEKLLSLQKKKKKKPKSCIFKGWHLANGSSEPNNP